MFININITKIKFNFVLIMKVLNEIVKKNVLIIFIYICFWDL